MEARIGRLETLVDKVVERLDALERDVAVIKSNYATKADIAEVRAQISDARNSIAMWVVSAVLLAQILPALLKKFGI
jgi:DNA-binding ferritin-like protein